MNPIEKYSKQLKRIFQILNADEIRASVSINGDEDYLSSIKDTIRVHGVNFSKDESVVNLFSMAHNFEHLVFEECKFSNEFKLKLERSNTGRLRRVSFLGP